MAIGAGALRAGKAAIECALLVKPVERQLRALQARVQAIGRSFTSAGTFGAAGGGFAGLRNLLVGTLAGQALLYPVKLAANFELATAQMSVFTGSVDSANAAMMELMKFSAIAAQAPEEMANQMRLLMTRDISAEDSLTFIKSLAVLAAGSRDQFEELVKAFADVRSATRLNGEEMRQFKNTAFNPLTEISRRTGESMAQLKARMEAGGISFDEVAQALQDTVREGGRFHGMLEKIGGTLTGKFNIALAKAKLAIKPLGDAALPGVKKIFENLTNVIDAFAASISRNASWYVTVLKIGGAIVGLAIAAITFGLAWQVVGFALGGVAGSLGLVVSILGLLLNPVTIVIGALGLLAAWFTTSTENGRRFASGLAAYFGRLKSVAIDSFNGIADALAAGNLTAAAEVLWAGLNLAWINGIYSLSRVWQDFAFEFRRVAVDAFFAIERFQNEFNARFASGWMNILTKMKTSYWDFWAWLEKIGSSEEEKLKIDLYAAKQKGALLNDNAAMQGQIEQELQKAQRDVLEAQRTAREMLDKDHGDAAARAQEDLNNAKSKLAALKDEAEVMAAIAALTGQGGFGIGGGFDKIAGAAATAAKNAFKQPSATLDPRHVAESLGGRVQNEQLNQLRQINRNTARGGGLPVV